MSFAHDHDDIEDIELSGVFKHQTAKAYLIAIDGRDHWIPRSQISGGDFEPEQLQPGQPIVFSVSPWFADQAGLA